MPYQPHNTIECCKNHNKMNKKIEQGKIRVNVVKITSIKLNKSIDFLEKLCYDKNSRETHTKTKNKRKENEKK